MNWSDTTFIFDLNILSLIENQPFSGDSAGKKKRKYIKRKPTENNTAAGNSTDSMQPSTSAQFVRRENTGGAIDYSWVS